MNTHDTVERLAPSRAARADVPIVHQLVFAVLYLTTVLTLGYSDVTISMPWFVVAGAGIELLVLLVAGLLPWWRLPAVAQLPLPLANVVMIAGLEMGTDFGATYVAALIFLPVVSMAWIDQWRGAVLGTVLTVGVLLLPLVAMPDRTVTSNALTRSVVVAGIAFALGAFVAVVARAQRLRGELLVERTAQVRQSRDTMAGLIDAATEQAIIATDADGRIEVFNQGAERLTGRAARDLLGTQALDLRLPAELDAAVAERGLDATGRDLDSVRLQAVVGAAADGGVEVHDWSLLRDGEPAGTVRVTVTRRPPHPGVRDAGYLFVSTDITRQVETERAQHQFIGYVSHELRTPISSVLGYVDLLELDADDLSDTQRGYLEVIRRNGRRQLRLVEDLLLTAQVDAGRFSVRPEPVDLGGVVAGAVRTAAPQAESAGVELADTTSGPVPLDGDPMRLGQLVDNLLSNALKFTPSGGRVTVHAELQARPNDVPGDRAEPAGPSPAAVLTVRDTGVGIPGDELRHLTDRFYRASSATVRRIPGAGLGLAITQAIVDAHGGTLSITSAVGSGTTFTVVLPVTPPGGRAE